MVLRHSFEFYYISGKTMHSNHMILVNLKFSLCGFYGRIPGYTMNEMTEEMLSGDKCVVMLYRTQHSLEMGI